MKVRVETERSQHRNLETAKEALRARLSQGKATQDHEKRNEKRREAISPNRVRTVAFQRDQVTDHRTGKTISTKLFLRGRIDILR